MGAGYAQEKAGRMPATKTSPNEFPALFDWMEASGFCANFTTGKLPWKLTFPMSKQEIFSLFEANQREA